MASEIAEAKELRASLGQLRGVRAATIALVADVDDLQAEWTPRKGSWSVAQVLDHLLKTDQFYRDQIGKLFELKAAGKPPVIEIDLQDLNTRPIGVPAA